MKENKRSYGSFSQHQLWNLPQRKYSISIYSSLDLFLYLGNKSEVEMCLLSVMVNFMCQLDWLSNPQITGKYYFCICVMVFLEEISIWIRLSKDLPLPIWGHTSLSRKVEEGQILSFFLSWDVYLPSSALWHWSFWFSSLLTMGLKPTSPLLPSLLALDWILPLMFLFS